MELKLSRRQRQEERSFSIHDAEAGSSKRGSEERKCFRGRWRSEEKRREEQRREKRRRSREKLQQRKRRQETREGCLLLCFFNPKTTRED